jgi:cytochrome c peroxidase
MFPVTSAAEMAGQAGENAVATAAADGNLAGFDGVWEQLADRVRAVQEYVSLFFAAYPEIVDPEEITMVHIANAIAAYEDVTFRAINSPVDRFLRGERWALSYNQQIGMRLFYGKAGCSNCHSGPFQTDHDYHAIGMPQIGPGKGDTGPGGDGFGDFGREQVTADPADRYKFRTPSLRNVALTGPWGHDGAYNDLEAMVRHHLNAEDALAAYDTSQAVLPPATAAIESTDFVHQDSAVNRAAIAAAIDPLLPPIALSDQEVGLLMEFLHALTDPASMDLRTTVPISVPSGLPLAD